MSESVRVTVTLPKGIVDKIKRLADINDTTLANTIIESVNLNEAISEGERVGAKIIIEQPNGSGVILRRFRPDAR